MKDLKMIKNKIHSLYYALITISWVFFFGEATRRLFPDNILLEVGSLVCGFSIGFLICLTSSFIVNRLGAQKK